MAENIRPARRHMQTIACYYLGNFWRGYLAHGYNFAIGYQNIGEQAIALGAGVGYHYLLQKQCHGAIQKIDGEDKCMPADALFLCMP
jgi:hypothetical protein